MLKQNIELKAELICRGMHIDKIAHRLGVREGGVGRAGEVYIEIDGSNINVPVTGNFITESPYALVYDDDSYSLLKGGEYVCDVIFHPPIFYAKKTPDGMRKFARVFASSCFGTTVIHKCIYWRSGEACKFCGIEHALKYAVAQKDPIEVGKAAEKAHKMGRAGHVTLTTGNQASRHKEVELLAETIREIKARVDIPIHIVIGAFEDTSLLEGLSGADTIDIDAESLDPRVFQTVCPGKARVSDFKTYMNNWRAAIDIFGRNQVSSWILVGMGEEWGITLENMERMISIGAIPHLVPFRPTPNTPMADMKPPEPEHLLRLCEAASDVMRKYGVDPNENLGGCVKCGASSVLMDVYNKEALNARTY